MKPITRREFLKHTGLALAVLALPSTSKVITPPVSIDALLWYYTRDAWNNVVIRNRQRAMLSSRVYPKAIFVRDSFYGPLALNDGRLGYDCYRWFERTQDPLSGQIRTAVPFLAENEFLFQPQDDDSSLLFIAWSMWLKRRGFPINRAILEKAFDFVKAHVQNDWFVSAAGPFRYWADTVAAEVDERITHNQGLYVLALRSMIELGWGGVTDRDLTAARSNYIACYRSDIGALRLGLDSWWNDKLDISVVFPEFMLRYLFSESALPDYIIRSTVDHVLQVASIYKNGLIAGVKVICANDGSFLLPEKFFAAVLNRQGDYQNGGYWPMYTLTALALRYKIDPSPTLKQTIEQLVRSELATDHRSKEVILMIPGEVGLFDPNRSGYTWNALIAPALKWAKVV
ncbi:MAG TPA: hypothetical protein VFK30_08825 [Anaerolineae bacterium]|nr:hypothetical protein [Anaerolineae bacterium]